MRIFTKVIKWFHDFPFWEHCAMTRLNFFMTRVDSNQMVSDSEKVEWLESKIRVNPSQITRVSFESWLEIYTSHGESDWLESLDYDYLWPPMVIYGHLWLFKTLIWPFMAIYVPAMAIFENEKFSCDLTRVKNSSQNDLFFDSNQKIKSISLDFIYSSQKLESVWLDFDSKCVESIES